MRDQNQCRIVVTKHSCDDFPCVGIESAEGFISKDDLRVGDQSTGNADALALAARQMRRFTCQELGTQTQLGKKFLRTSLGFPRGSAPMRNSDWFCHNGRH